MKRLTLLLVLLLTGSLHAQTLHTKDFAPTWVTVPKPAPLTLQHRLTGDVAEQGTYEFAMSWIDEQGRTSPLSDPVTITATLRNWTVNARLPNYPVWTRAVGWVLWCRRTSGFTVPAPPSSEREYDWRPFGGQSNCNNSGTVTRPILPVCGWESHLIRGHPLHRSVRWHGGQLWPTFLDDAFWPKSSTLGKPAMPPIVRVQQFPNRKHRIAISWCCNQGESPLSDALTVEQFVAPKWFYQQAAADAEFHGGDMIYRGDSPPPQGALGMYVYVQWEGSTQWRRQKAPWGEGYLWPFINYLPLHNFKDTNINPSGIAGQSLLSPLQMAIENGNGNVIVDSDQTIYCPVINQLSNTHGGTMGRTITAPHGVRWKLSTGIPDPDKVDWPLWVECSQETKIVNCDMSSSYATGGIEFCGYHDSSCFYFSPVNLRVHLTRNGYTSCIRQLAEARSQHSHTCSEPVFSGLTLGGQHPIVCEGNQSANWLIKGASIVCYGGIESACISAGNSGTIQFTERLVLAGSKESDPDKFSGGRAIWANVSTLNAEVERVFVDQGFPAWFVVGGLKSPSIDMSLTQTNQWTNWLHVVEAPNGSKESATDLLIRGKASQHVNPISTLTYAGRPNGVAVSKSDKLTLLQAMSKVPVQAVVP